MRQRLLPRLTFANVISVLALFVALGGVSYAAVTLPAHSVGTLQLKKNAVTLSKIAPHARAAQRFTDGAGNKQVYLRVTGRNPRGPRPSSG